MAKRDGRRARRAAAKKRAAAYDTRSQERLARQLAALPLEGAWVDPAWERTGLTPVVMARRGGDGALYVGRFLVDLLCLGVKQAHLEVKVSDALLVRIRDRLAPPGRALVSVPPEQAASIVEAARTFAAACGLSPHDGYAKASAVLSGIDVSGAAGITTGQDGMPYLMPGPKDDVAAIVAILEAQLGKDGFLVADRAR